MTNGGSNRSLPSDIMSFLDDVRASNDLPIKTMAGSSVILVNQTMRLGFLIQIMPLTTTKVQENGELVRIPDDFMVYQQAAAYLAMKHFNERNSAIVPGLTERLRSCNFHFTMEITDTQSDILRASRQFFESASRNHSLATPNPTGVVGAYWSSESKPLAILSGAFQTPEISPSSTSTDLDQKSDAPLFARTVPTNTGDANATVAYFQTLGVTHFAIIFLRDPFGTAYYSSLVAAASAANMTVIASPFDENDKDTIRSAVHLVAENEYKYIFTIASQISWKLILNEAYDLGIVGTSEHFWLMGEGLEFIELKIDHKKEPEVAAALHGMGIVMLEVPVNKHLMDALEHFKNDTQTQQHFIASQIDPTVFDSYNFSASDIASSTGPYVHTNYDAAMAFGIAACDVENDFFTGQELFDQIKKSTFTGASGQVSFDPLTGTRMSGDVVYVISNLVKNSQDSTDDVILFDVISSIEVTAGKITVIEPFVYSNNGLVAPQSLPSMEMDLNLIPNGTRIFGWSLSALVILLSIWCFSWTVKHRKRAMIRASQPIFLCQICIGTIIMALTIVPLSFQEPVGGLDISCMAVPWLFTTGFVLAFSSLMAKQWRINKLFQTSGQMRRTEIKARDAMWIVGLLLPLNYVVLTAWTVVAPLQWTRIHVDNFDNFGRSVETYGTCWPGESSSQLAFLCVLFFMNLVLVIVANYQSFLARNIPSDFNESTYITLSMASILETMLLGIPIVFLVLESPTAAFVVESLLITALCLAILLPLFIPKYLRKTRAIDRNELNEHWRLHRSSQQRSVQ